MRKKDLSLLLALAGLGMTANAQVVATLGFEEGDQFYHNPDSAQFASFYADHINLYGGDVWTEKSTDAHSGAYALEAVNVNTNRGNTWDRGLKLRGLNIEEQKSYRVSFWVKANQTFTMAEGGDPINTAIKSTLSIGHENLEAPLVSQGGTEYYYNWTDGIMTGDWRRLSFVAYNSGKAVQDQYFDKYDNNIKEVIVNDPEDPSKNDTIWWKGDYTSFPDTYFLTINMYNPGTYLLDDITIEEATMAGCYWNYDAIKVDFGYPTNVAQLANASTDPIGVRLLPNSCVSVTNGGEPVEVVSVELKADGYMYIFLAEEIDADAAANFSVSFTPDADCPVVYTTDRRPSMDVESEMTVLGFEGESIYLDETIEEMSYMMDGPIFISATPEDHSFELDPATFNEVRLTYDRPVSLEIASVALDLNGVVTDLYGATTVDSEDPNTIVVSVGSLADGQYRLTVTNVTNANSGLESLEAQVVNFSVGEDTSSGEVKVVYSSDDFATTANGTFPVGWLSDDGERKHQYGLTASGEVVNYNWGGNTGGGGSRMMTGYTGDFNGGALYWLAIGGHLGKCTFGEQVKDYVMPDGTLDPEMDPRVALYLEPSKYQVTFRMAAWKAFDDGSFPRYNFSLESIDLNNPDADGEVVAQFNDVEARPNVNGAQNIRVDGATLSTTEFTVDEPGYYMLKFTCQSAGGYHEFLLGSISMETKPSDAAYYKGLLQVAVDSATVVADLAADDIYNGATKTALLEAMAAANGQVNTPSQVDELRNRLYSLCGQMLDRMEDVDVFDVNLTTLRDNVANVDASSKYGMTDEYAEGLAALEKYDGTTVYDYDDEALDAAVQEMATVGGKVANIWSCVQTLTYRLRMSAATARKVNVENESVILAAENAISDDDEVAAELNNNNKLAIYKAIAEAGSISAELNDSIYSETVGDETTTTGYKLLSAGLDVTGFVKNPQFYTYAASAADTLNSTNTPGWETLEGFAHLRDGAGSYLIDATHWVVNSMYNAYRGRATVGQTISDLPVGIYDVVINTRTAPGKIGGLGGDSIPDMYIWASTVEGDTLRTAYEQGNMKWSEPEAYPTVIKNVTVREGDILSIGLKEAYASGLSLNDDGTDQGSWDTNTYVDNVRLIFVAPLEGYDYAQAYTDDIASVKAEPVAYEYYSLGGVKLARPMKGVNIVKIHRADGSVDVQKVTVK